MHFQDNPEQFWTRVRIGSGDDCSLFIGAKPNQYGSVRRENRHLQAHRIAWELTYGDIPPGMFVLHRCDNPPCVRPDHLFLGTQKDNAQDMSRKRRSGAQRDPESYRARGKTLSHQLPHVSGADHVWAKLTWPDVHKIRADYAAGATTYAALGRQYGVTEQAIYLIVKRINWKEEGVTSSTPY